MSIFDKNSANGTAAAQYDTEHYEMMVPSATGPSRKEMLTDDAVIEGYVPDLVYTPQEETAVRRKIDFHLMTFLLVCMFVYRMDKANISNAISDHLPQHLEFSYSWINDTNMVCSIVVALVSIPNNFIAKRIGAHRWIPILMASWAITTLAHVFLQDKAGFMVARIFIAISVAGFVPTCLVYLTSFYKTRELPERLAWFYGLETFAAAISGLIAFGVFQLAGRGGWHGWQWLYLIDGVVSLFMAILAFLHLPLTPAHTGTLLRGRKPWLSEREAQIAVTRIIRDDASKTEQEKFLTLADIRSAASDSRVWVHLLIIVVEIIPRVPIEVYFPTMIREFGFEVAISNLLTVPANLICLVVSVIVARHADKRGFYAFHDFTLVGLRQISRPSASAPSSLVQLVVVLISQECQAHKSIRKETTRDITRHFRYLHLNRKRDAKWTAMTDKEQAHYLETTMDKGNDRLDYRFTI
ncbi:major facilitator superfamily domain-containing protein [Gongronella butleri]|nr:major facilitator superfamily domain-containing protein [Gongronella butleri]